MSPASLRQESSASGGLTITAAGSANTKGSYTEALTASAFDVASVSIMLFGGTASRKYLVDFAIGAAGAEQIVVPDWFHVVGSATRVGVEVSFPVRIPAGTRSALRCQSATASANLGGWVSYRNHAAQAAPPGGGRYEAWGANTATTAGVAITPGTTAESAYAQLVAATAFAVRAVWLSLGVVTGGTRTSEQDLAIGAAGSEQILATNLATAYNTTTLYPMVYEVQAAIPAGTRVALRSWGSGSGLAIEAVGYGVAA